MITETFLAADRRIYPQAIITFIFGFALASAYCPYITGAAATPRWCVLVALAAGALIFLPRVRWQAAPVAWGAVFMVWALGSLLWSDAFEGRDQAWKLALYAALFLAGGQISSLRPFYRGATVGLAISGALVILDLLGLISYQQVGRPSGLFVNGLYLAEFAAMVMAGLVGSGLAIWAASCVPCLFFVAVARGPLLAFAAAIYAEIIVRTRRDVVVGLGLLVCLLFLFAALRPATVWVRLELWTTMLPHLTLWGHGLGAFFGDGPLMSVYEDYLRDGRPPHANNDLLEIAYDLGAVGVVSAIGFIASLMRKPFTAERLVILVFVIEGCFGFGFFLPWSAGLFCLAAGHAARCRDIRLPAAVPRRIPIRTGAGRNFGPIVSRLPDRRG